MKKTTFRPAKNIIGPAVRRIRLLQPTAVSQQDLAGRLAALGISVDRSAVTRIESSERYVLDYEAEALAKALRVPIERLFGK